MQAATPDSFAQPTPVGGTPHSGSSNGGPPSHGTSQMGLGGAAGGPPDGRRAVRLPPEVNRILYVRNLPYKITSDELYDIFGKFGSIRQIRKGNTAETKGTAFVVYDDVYDAKLALDSLSGFNVDGRYLVLLYYNQRSRARKAELAAKQEENEMLKKMYGVKTDAEEKRA